MKKLLCAILALALVILPVGGSMAAYADEGGASTATVSEAVSNAESSVEGITAGAVSAAARKSVVKAAEKSVNWAKIYRKYLKKHTTWIYEDSVVNPGLKYTIDGCQFVKMALIYVNNDNIPELVVFGEYESEGCIIYTIGKNNKVKKLVTSRLNFKYVKKGNVIDNCDGSGGYYYDKIYKIKNGKWKLVAEGSYEIDSDDYWSDNPDYIYKWNGKTVSKAAYKKKVAQYISAKKATKVKSKSKKSYNKMMKYLKKKS